MEGPEWRGHASLLHRGVRWLWPAQYMPPGPRMLCGSALEAYPSRGTYLAEKDMLKGFCYVGVWSQVNAGHVHYVNFGVPTPAGFVGNG